MKDIIEATMIKKIASIVKILSILARFKARGSISLETRVFPRNFSSNCFFFLYDHIKKATSGTINQIKLRYSRLPKRIS